MFRIKIGLKIILFFSFIICIFGISMFLNFNNMNDIKILADEIEPINHHSIHLHELSTSLNSFEEAVDHYFIVWNYENQEKAENEAKNMLHILDEIEESDDGGLKEKISALKAIVSDLQKGFTDITKLDINKESDVKKMNNKILFVYDGIAEVKQIEKEIIDLNSELVKENLRTQKELINSSLRQAIIMFSMIFFFTVILSILIGRSISNPIHALHKGTEEIEKGNLDVNLKIKSNDEIGELAVAFNQMAEALATSKSTMMGYSKNLEKKVGERTKELEIKNEELKKFNKLAVDRELKMIELKKRIKELEESYHEEL